MKRIKSIIDFEIIWKKIHSSISESEEELLDRWMSESKKHKELFNRAKRHYAKNPAYNKDLADSKKAFKEVYSHISASRKAIVKRRFIVYASAAASILIVIGFYLVWPWYENETVVLNSEQHIEPGTQKARLILDDGSSYDLSAGKELSIQEEETKIHSEGTSIQYSKEKKLFAKVKYNTLKVPVGSEYILDLSDGTRVWLNSETTIKYPVQFVGKERKVELTGEAYFKVAKNENKPFKVFTGNQVVQVLGTSFNINSYMEDSLISTTLVEGSVHVFLENHPEVSQILKPGYQSRMNKQTTSIAQYEVDIEPFVAWKEGRFYFKKQTLEDMMKTLSRWYDVTVMFSNEDSKEIRFTGDLMRYENFENILDLLEKTHEVKFTVEGRTVIIE